MEFVEYIAVRKLSPGFGRELWRPCKSPKELAEFFLVESFVIRLLLGLWNRPRNCPRKQASLFPVHLEPQCIVRLLHPISAGILIFTFRNNTDLRRLKTYKDL